MLLLANGFLAAVSAFDGIPPALERLTVHIEDQVSVPAATLQKAILQAQAILLNAGIETSWRMSVFPLKFAAALRDHYPLFTRPGRPT
jgi:hypothetical protein